jgi:hypothetical protein
MEWLKTPLNYNLQDQEAEKNAEETIMLVQTLISR